MYRPAGAIRGGSDGTGRVKSQVDTSGAGREDMLPNNGTPNSGLSSTSGVMVAGVGARAWHFVRVATLSAVGISILVHLLLWLVASVVTVLGGGAPGPSGSGSPGPVEFAVISEEAFAGIQGEELRDEAPMVSDGGVDQPDTSIDLLDTAALTGVSDLGLDLGSIGASVGAGDIGSASSLSGGGGGGGGGGGTSFFGVEAEGNRFSYIVDMSGSMNFPGKWDRTAQELMSSIEELSEGAMFQVVLFSGDAFPLDNKKEWSEANERGKKWARTALLRVVPTGATNPSPAFHVVFSSRPRPDAVYFMTDGEFNESVVGEIEAMNAEMQIPIHCITFGDRRAEPVMREIARKSGGTYTHVDGGTP